jgi:hypothetical protein
LQLADLRDDLIAVGQVQAAVTFAHQSICPNNSNSSVTPKSPPIGVSSSPKCA